MNFLHYKLLQARTKDQEDRIVNLMLAETKRNKDTTNQPEYRIKAEPNIHNKFFE